MCRCSRLQRAEADALSSPPLATHADEPLGVRLRPFLASRTARRSLPQSSTELAACSARHARSSSPAVSCESILPTTVALAAPRRPPRVPPSPRAEPVPFLPASPQARAERADPRAQGEAVRRRGIARRARAAAGHRARVRRRLADGLDAQVQRPEHERHAGRGGVRPRPHRHAQLDGARVRHREDGARGGLRSTTTRCSRSCTAERARREARRPPREARSGRSDPRAGTGTERHARALSISRCSAGSRRSRTSDETRV